MKRSDKYNYVRVSRSTDQGTRTYDLEGQKLPSVTTILGQTKDQAFLDRWRAKVGHEEAERVKNLSSKRGTSMHKFIEKHITGAGYDDLTEIGQQAKPMAQKIINHYDKLPVRHTNDRNVRVHYSVSRHGNHLLNEAK